MGPGDVRRSRPLRWSCHSGPRITLPSLCTCSLCPAPTRLACHPSGGIRCPGLARGWTCDQARPSAQPAVTVQRRAPAPAQLQPQLAQSFCPAPHGPSPRPSLRLHGQVGPEHKAQCAEWRTDTQQTCPLFCWSGGALGSRGLTRRELPPEMQEAGLTPWGLTFPGVDSQWCVLEESPCTQSLAHSPPPCPTGAPLLTQPCTTCRRNPLPHPELTVRTFAGVLAVSMRDKEFGKHRHGHKTQSGTVAGSSPCPHQPQGSHPRRRHWGALTSAVSPVLTQHEPQ